ncbi:MAG: NTP transferase domain-containing protein, partial [Oscillospiraceae bacterium]|nr:NTP transferase domain-containing protein [Oscillospiraceae bacterium]
MKALILNSGMGTRMGVLTAEHPKCMTDISARDTILSRQLRQIAGAGIRDVVITTGPFRQALTEYCQGLGLPLRYTFVHNPDYRGTNYIYSIYLAREGLDDDLILLHGDLVMEDEAFRRVVESPRSCMAVSAQATLPEKDFKAVIRDGRIAAVGVEFFDHAMAAQPLYRLERADWSVWLSRIGDFCRSGRVDCYAENALNEVADRCAVYPVDVGDLLCAEVDNPEDLYAVSARLQELENRTVYLCFSSDILHGGHMSIIRKAAALGRVTIGVLSDEAVASYKRFPLLTAQERCTLFQNIKGVERVVEQKELSYRNILLELKPDIVVHGDDWREGFQQPLRQEVLDVTASYGGRLVEFPYARDPQYAALERRARAELSLPDSRRG